MPTPSKVLVGQNAKIIDEEYSDNYLKALNEFASVDEVFGENKEKVAGGNWDAVSSITANTLGDSIYEHNLIDIVVTAAGKGQWSAYNNPKMTDGLKVASDKHYIHLTEHKGQIFSMPTTSYLRYCKERLNP